MWLKKRTNYSHLFSMIWIYNRGFSVLLRLCIRNLNQHSYFLILQFLEEARNHAINFNVNQDYPSMPFSAAVETTKSNKKSWKESLCSWWKMDKRKSSAQLEATLIDASRVPTKKPSSVSGPVIRGGGRRGPGGRRPMSGPLAECFTPKRVVEQSENELPYMCLSQHKYPPSVQAFGPIYLVTWYSYFPARNQWIDQKLP